MTTTHTIMDVVRVGLSEGIAPSPTTKADLAQYLERTFGVVIPDKHVCRHHVSPWRVFCEAYFAEHRVIIIKGSRLFAGKSFFLAQLGLTEAVTLGCDVSILGGSGAQSRRVVKYMHKAWQHPRAPRELLANADPGQFETPLTTGNTIEALLASQRSVRGSHPTRLRMDEVDEMDLDLYDSASGLTFGRDDIAAHKTIASTHHNPDGTFSEILRRAQHDGTPTREWCYRETLEPHGWLTRAEVMSKRTEFTKARWDTEVELQEPSPEGRAIIPAKVDQMFDRSLGEFDGDEGEYIEIEKPDPAGAYCTGADWGKDVHWTIIKTFRVDCTPVRVVAFERLGRRPWPKMTKRFAERVKRFPGPGWHDLTGVGKVVSDVLATQGVDIETVPTKAQLTRPAKRGKARGIIMAGRSRLDLFDSYIAAIEGDEIESPYIAFDYRQHKFVRVEDLDVKHPPDCLVGGAMAHAARCAYRRKKKPVSARVGSLAITSGAARADY